MVAHCLCVMFPPVQEIMLLLRLDRFCLFQLIFLCPLCAVSFNAALAIWRSAKYIIYTNSPSQQPHREECPPGFIYCRTKCEMKKWKSKKKIAEINPHLLPLSLRRSRSGSSAGPSVSTSHPVDNSNIISTVTSTLLPPQSFSWRSTCACRRWLRRWRKAATLRPYTKALRLLILPLPPLTTCMPWTHNKARRNISSFITRLILIQTTVPLSLSLSSSPL